jgi:dimethylaniline monooxygenase (N-oxide forming)
MYWGSMERRYVAIAARTKQHTMSDCANQPRVLVARTFDDFWTQSPLRMTSFSDIALELPCDAPLLHDTFSSQWVTRYLEEYIDRHVYHGRSIHDRIRLEAEVSGLERLAGADGWVVHIRGPRPQMLRCTKLAVAAGMSSFPIMPGSTRSQHWKATILHHRDFGKHAPTILAPQSAYNNITVLGGGKSAADMVYAAVKAGKKVNWIIQASGEGPGIFMNPTATGRYRNNVEAGATRAATLFNPSGFHLLQIGAQVMHRSTVGRKILIHKFFASDHRYKAWANYGGREKALPGFQELEPKASYVAVPLRKERKEQRKKQTAMAG